MCALSFAVGVVAGFSQITILLFKNVNASLDERFENTIGLTLPRACDRLVILILVISLYYSSCSNLLSEVDLCEGINSSI